MKRSYQNLTINKDGTISGIRSISSIERICIFTDSFFTITGYYDAEEDELVELLFVYYIMPDGVVPRRIFERCIFSFVDFTRDQIDNVMNKLSRKKRPGNLYYSFSQCKVLSDGVELVDYPLHEDETANELLYKMPNYVRKAALKPNCRNQYNLRDMTAMTKDGNDTQFSQDYHQLMKLRRTSRQLGITSYNNKKRRVCLYSNPIDLDKQQQQQQQQVI